MPDVNADMKATAEYAVKSAHSRFNLNFDYSENSITALDSILEKMYWGFSGHVNKKGNDGLIYNTATIWGSYLGEYMRRRWGGAWKQKGSQQVIAINGKEFSPISFVYQRITGHFNYKLEDYLFETNQTLDSVQGSARQEQYIQDLSEALEKKTSRPRDRKLVLNKKNLLYVAFSLGSLLVISVCFILLVNFSRIGLPAIGVLERSTPTASSTPAEMSSLPATEIPPTITSPAAVLAPSDTPLPSHSPPPSSTAFLTATQPATLSPTETHTPAPTDTSIPYTTPLATDTPVPPTHTPRPATPTSAPTSTATQVPRPTDTLPPPSLLSCGVSPSSVAVGEQTRLQFTVQFSAAGYDMSVTSFTPGDLPGQQGCSDANSDGDASASCSGLSGYLPPGTQVRVEIHTPLGNCSVSYQAH
jgi:cytoskeletal protein RodZ